MPLAQALGNKQPRVPLAMVLSAFARSSERLSSGEDRGVKGTAGESSIQGMRRGTSPTSERIRPPYDCFKKQVLIKYNTINLEVPLFASVHTNAFVQTQRSLSKTKDEPEVGGGREVEGKEGGDDPLRHAHAPPARNPWVCTGWGRGTCRLYHGAILLLVSAV